MPNYLIPDGDTGVYAQTFENETDIWSGEIHLNGSLDVLGRPAKVTLGAERSDLNRHRRNGVVTTLGEANK